MRRTVLFIAMSLDGYIADQSGGVDWLAGQEPDVENEDSYSKFVRTVDTVVMGWETYRQVTEELSPTEWVYSDLKSYVITHREKSAQENIQFVNESPAELIRRLKAQSGKDIWICGGASIVQQLMMDKLIDRFYISVIPVILGGGIRLFGTQKEPLELKLLESRNYRDDLREKEIIKEPGVGFTSKAGSWIEIYRR